MFNKARIQLTLWYVFGLMIVSILFSLGIYHVQIQEFQRFERMRELRFENQLNQNFSQQFDRPRRVVVPDPQLIEEVENRLKYFLVILNGAILLISAGVGYILAGRTLKPIAVMVESQETFVSNASHELKTPLAALKTGFEVYLRDKKHTLTDADSLIKDSLEDVERMNYLTASLLSTARIKKIHDMTKERIKNQDLVTMSIKQVKSLSQVKHLTVLPIVEEAWVYGNRESLVQALVILLDNAIKFSEMDETITVVSKPQGSSVIFSIQDNGLGIAKEDHKKIFERFYRTDSSRSRESGGYGLGLSIAKTIVESHKGKIRVQSELHKGSIFIISLPQA